MASIPGFQSEIESVLSEAVEKSKGCGRPVLAVAAARCDPFDPIETFAAAGSDRRVFWRHPDEGLTLVGIGAEREEVTAGHDRFRSTKGAWLELVANSFFRPGDCPVSLPLAFGGFSFRAANEGDQTRAGPAGLLVIPRLLFVEAQGQHWVVASRLVCDASEPRAEAQALMDEIGRVSKSATCREPRGSDVRFEAQADYGTWKQSVEAVLKEIAAAEVEKVVLARVVHGASTNQIDVAPVLSRLTMRYPQAAVFAFGAGESCFLGASPERLVGMKDGKVSVDCLAGSIRRATLPGADEELALALLRDPKERHEHEVVLRALSENLRPLCEDLEIPPEPSILRTATVQHLHTPVRARVRDGIQVLDLIERLHPTPATGGYPREKALDLIEKYEKLDRGWYAGPVGWIDGAGNGDFAVAIRSGLIEGKKVTLYAGSGIVAGSDPVQEYEETNIKLETMAWALKTD